MGEVGCFLNRWSLQPALSSPTERLPGLSGRGPSNKPTPPTTRVPSCSRPPYRAYGIPPRKRQPLSSLRACARRLDPTHHPTLLRGAGLPPGAPESGKSSFPPEEERSCRRDRTPESRRLLARKVRPISGHPARRMTTASL